MLDNLVHVMLMLHIASNDIGQMQQCTHWHIGMVTIQQEAEKSLQSGEMSEDSVAAFFEAKQGQIMIHLWKLNVADIEGTLTRVVDRVCPLLMLSCMMFSFLACVEVNASQIVRM